MSIETSTVRVGDLSAYLARPTTGSTSGMLLLPMVTGIGEQVRAWADELAERGFTALAWDVFHGISTDNTPREELAAKVESPAYCAKRRCVPTLSDDTLMTVEPPDSVGDATDPMETFALLKIVNVTVPSCLPAASRDGSIFTDTRAGVSPLVRPRTIHF